MNDLDLCLEVVWRSRQPLCYIWRWISRKPLEIEVWFQRTTNRKWHMGYQMVTRPMTSHDPKNVLWCSTVGYPSNSLASCSCKFWYKFLECVLSPYTPLLTLTLSFCFRDCGMTIDLSLNNIYNLHWLISAKPACNILHRNCILIGFLSIAILL